MESLYFEWWSLYWNRPQMIRMLDKALCLAPVLLYIWSHVYTYAFTPYIMDKLIDQIPTLIDITYYNFEGNEQENCTKNIQIIGKDCITGYISNVTNKMINSILLEATFDLWVSVIASICLCVCVCQSRARPCHFVQSFVEIQCLCKVRCGLHWDYACALINPILYLSLPLIITHLRKDFFYCSLLLTEFHIS